MAASIIPPPIVSTARQGPRPTPATHPVRSMIIEKEPAIVSSEDDLQLHLQSMLDAQASALRRAIDGDVDSMTGSLTPTSHSGPLNQVNRPVRRRISLHTARREIYKGILALSAIKEEDLANTSRSLREKNSDIERIAAWQMRRTGLLEATSSIGDSEETARAASLKQEADSLTSDIARAEAHLAELKTRQRSLLQQAKAVENSVQAKLASYASSLAILDADIKTYLTARTHGSAASKRTKKEAAAAAGHGASSVWELPPQRRTLEMAREQLEVEQAELRRQDEIAEAERAALDSGAVMWKEVAGAVTAFEKTLRAEMAALSERAQRDDANEGMKGVYAQLRSVITALEGYLQRASEQSWTLLIAAIGAELDALRRGEEILSGVVGGLIDTGLENGDYEPGRTLLGDGLTDDIADRETTPKTISTHHNGPAGHDDTDEEPDPDLLFSAQEDD